MRILGMMSGTSVDAIDTALVDLTRDPVDPEVLRLRWISHAEHPWPEELRAQILGVLPPASSDVGAWTRLDVQVGETFAEVARDVLGRHAGADLVVTHGQTLFHWVEADGSPRGSLQIGDASRIAAATGVPVLYDVRAADLSHGGHGAPLAPVLDRLLAGARPTAFLNLGGISNASLIDGERILAGDLGPANALIDALVLAATGEPFDRDGALAARGTVHRPMLEQLLADPYLTRPLPKSTGREYFDGGYVRRQIGAGVGGTGAADVLPDDLADQVATLTEFTARCVADALASAGHDGAGGIEIDRVIGSGGGMDNPVFRDRLAELLAPVPLLRSEDIGVPSGAKEALLMAVIGYLSAHGMPAVPASAEVPGRTTTGATPAILGSLTPPVPLDGLDPCSTVYPRALRVMT